MTDSQHPWPWRMIARGAFQDGWSLADQEEKNYAFRALKEVFSRWGEMDCRLVATLDDELSMIGQPGARLWNFYTIWEIPDPATAYELLNLFRVENQDHRRLDRYFRIELVVGKPILGVESAVGLSPATGEMKVE